MNKYYIYLHRRLSDNVVFYIGKGCGRRYLSKQNRSKDWLDESSSGYYHEIIHDNLSNNDAIHLENQYLSNPETSWQLVNVNPPSVVKELKYEHLSKIFALDSKSPSGLVWNTVVKGGHNRNQVLKNIGDFAGNIYGKYYEVRYNYNLYRVHRIIYCLYHKIDLPIDKVVDHIDSNKENNSIDNLQLLSHRENSIKMKIKSTNKSGVTGVVNVDNKRWVVRLQVEDKVLIKSFYMKNYNSVELAKQAAISYNTELRRQHGYC